MYRYLLHVLSALTHACDCTAILTFKLLPFSASLSNSSLAKLRKQVKKNVEGNLSTRPPIPAKPRSITAT